MKSKRVTNPKYWFWWETIWEKFLVLATEPKSVYLLKTCHFQACFWWMLMVFSIRFIPILPVFKVEPGSGLKMNSKLRFFAEIDLIQSKNHKIRGKMPLICWNEDWKYVFGSF